MNNITHHLLLAAKTPSYKKYKGPWSQKYSQARQLRALLGWAVHKYGGKCYFSKKPLPYKGPTFFQAFDFIHVNGDTKNFKPQNLEVVLLKYIPKNQKAVLCRNCLAINKPSCLRKGTKWNISDPDKSCKNFKPRKAMKPVNRSILMRRLLRLFLIKFGQKCWFSNDKITVNGRDFFKKITFHHENGIGIDPHKKSKHNSPKNLKLVLVTNHKSFHMKQFEVYKYRSDVHKKEITGKLSNIINFLKDNVSFKIDSIRTKRGKNHTKYVEMFLLSSSKFTKKQGPDNLVISKVGRKLSVRFELKTDLDGRELKSIIMKLV